MLECEENTPTFNVEPKTHMQRAGRNPCCEPRSEVLTTPFSTKKNTDNRLGYPYFGGQGWSAKGKPFGDGYMSGGRQAK